MALRRHNVGVALPGRGESVPTMRYIEHLSTDNYLTGFTAISQIAQVRLTYHDPSGVRVAFMNAAGQVLASKVMSSSRSARELVRRYAAYCEISATDWPHTFDLEVVGEEVIDGHPR